MIAITTSSSIKVNNPVVLLCYLICNSLLLIELTSVINGLRLFFRPLPATTQMSCLLTCRAAPANSSPFAALTMPEGLRSLRSASSLSFLVILLPQNNSLTFVRGADRACCAPRKWQCSLTCAPRRWFCRPTTACLYQPSHAPRRGIGVRTWRRHLAARFMAFAVFIKRPTPIIPKSDAIVNRCGGIFYDFFKLIRERRGNSAFAGGAESGGRDSVTSVELAVEVRQ